MPPVTRRTFLAWVGRSGLALALFPASNLAVQSQWTADPPRIEIPGGNDWLAGREMQDIIQAGLGAYVVAGFALHHFGQLFRTYDFRICTSGHARNGCF